MGEIEKLSPPRTYKIQDRNGQWHTLTVPTMRDLPVIERRHGSMQRVTDEFMAGIREQAGASEILCTLLWVCMRREGRTSEQIKGEDWAYSFEDVSDMFTFSRDHIQDIQLVISDILLDAGWLHRIEEADPTSAGPEAGTAITETSPQELGAASLPS